MRRTRRRRYLILFSMRVLAHFTFLNSWSRTSIFAQYILQIFNFLYTNFKGMKSISFYPRELP